MFPPHIRSSFVREGKVVGDAVIGDAVGLLEGDFVGDLVGDTVGLVDGETVGGFELVDGDVVGETVGDEVVGMEGGVGLNVGGVLQCKSIDNK